MTPKYQYGEGCLSDQMIGQWLAASDRPGLDPAIRSTCARALRRDLPSQLAGASSGSTPTRSASIALNDERACCSAPGRAAAGPDLPFPLLRRGLVRHRVPGGQPPDLRGPRREGLAIVKGLRERHDGVRRNPWNEFECGSHYARSLASWGVLTALSGFEFDLPHRTFGFTPRFRPEDCVYFWSVDGAWGTYGQRFRDGKLTASLRVSQGSLPLQWLILGSVATADQAVVTVAGKRVEAETEVERGRLTVRLLEGVALQKGQELRVRVG